MTYRCHVCDRPFPQGGRYLFTVRTAGPDFSFAFCSYLCLRAWTDRNQQAMDERRRSACTEGHHRTPGWPGIAQWSPDPDDPYGDAQLWECTKGCGHIQRHPGYGINKAIHDRLGPEEFAKYRKDPANYRPPRSSG
jgi:hypothetical protein